MPPWSCARRSCRPVSAGGRRTRRAAAGQQARGRPPGPRSPVCATRTGHLPTAIDPGRRQWAAERAHELTETTRRCRPRGTGSGRGGHVSDDGAVMPRGSVSRTARLASLPLGAAGRATLGFGKRLSGRPADAVAAELQQRTAEQLFAVLGQLKGGAMKLGQTLSVFEAAVPEEMAAPYREALTKLQEEAPPTPVRTVHSVLAQQLGGRWRERFKEFDDAPAAAASIGQVHRATWRDGRDVAVKIQYPGAATALMTNKNQLARFARLFAALFPGMDVKPLIAELKGGVVEELDDGQASRNNRQLARDY